MPGLVRHVVVCYITAIMKRHAFSFRLAMLRLAFRVLGVLAPHTAASWAYRLWYTTHRVQEPQREIRQREKAQTYWLEHAHGRVAAYRWGESGRPLVICMHGWNGRAAQLGSIIQALVEAGHRVVAFDAPGHGYSDKQATNIFEIAEVLHAVVEQEGMPAIMIGHSFGCMILAYAVRHYGLTPEKLVFISAPTSTRYLIEQFAQTLRIPDRVMKIFHANLKHQFGDDVYERISAEQNMRDSAVPLLVVHDRQDLAVSWRNSERIVDVARAAQTHYTEGLGHRRILRDKRVIRRILAFVSEEAA